MSKNLGILPQLYSRPLVHHLEHDTGFRLAMGSPGENALRLRDRNLSAALVTPLDYARETSHAKLLPRVAVSSEGRGNVVTLHFREGLQSVSTIAVDPSSTGEIVLAKIVLAEQFESNPAIIPVIGSLETMLAKADAALVVGIDQVSGAATHENMLDLLDAWTDMTRLPYVHAVWCGRADDLTQEEVETIVGSPDGIAGSLDAIAGEADPDHASDIREYLEFFSYAMTEECEISITEFFRYAYYHGILPDIPELEFFGSGGDASDRIMTHSQN
jgi:chorismate dehydratase